MTDDVITHVRDAEGRPTSLDDFLAQSTDRLLRLAYLLTGSQHDAEDLVQDSLIKIHRHWRRVRATRNPTAYCQKMLLNLYLTGKRRRRRLTTTYSDLRDSGASPSPEAEVVERETLRLALAKLPERQRAVVVLKYYEQLSTTEISRLLVIEESSVRSALTRGLATLHEQFCTEGSGEEECESKMI